MMESSAVPALIMSDITDIAPSSIMVLARIKLSDMKRKAPAQKKHILGIGSRAR
jgi:hypothetical protein